MLDRLKLLVPARILSLVKPYEPIRVDRTDWDRQYQSGEWDHLGSLAELTRTCAVAGYCTFRSDSDILDLGCGDGALHRQLNQAYRSYVGVDISEAAIMRAREKATCSAEFVTADLELFTTERRFDVIVFNECLYYLHRPDEVLERAMGWLSSRGRIVVSMYHSGRGRRIWAMIDRLFTVEDAVRITRDRTIWDVKLLRR